MQSIGRKKLDPQRQRAAAICSLCGAELYPGESCWYINGACVCEDCLLSVAKAEFAAHRMICGEEREE